MSTRPNWFRFVASALAFIFVSGVAIAAIGPSYYPSLFAAGAVSEAPQAPASGPQATIGTCDTAGPVEVESTGGTPTPTAYATLKGAFDAINAGTHTGSINVEVCGNTTEAASASIDASGTGSASYTDVTIRPVGGARTIEGTLSGTSTGAIVKLNGADNVTIDGRQGGTGTARDLTIRNNSSETGAAAVWLSSLAADAGATNNVIRNLNLACGASNINALTTVGIIMSGTTISVTSNGADNDNNQFLFNRITSARYGIVTRGVTTNNNIAPIVTDNIIGPEAGFGADAISKTGILMQADTGGVVSRNRVQFIGGDFANTTAGTDRVGIGIGTDAAGTTSTTTITSGDYTVTNNIIHDVVEERTFSAAGIVLGTTRSGSPTNNLVANNFIYNVRANSTSPDQTVGISINGGNTDRIVFNSISLTGDVDPVGSSTPTTMFGNGIRIPGANGTNNANFTVANNSILIDLSSDTSTVHFYPITLNSSAYSFGTGFLNNNNYYINPTNPQLFTGGLASVAGAAATTEFATLANWQGALTTPQDANSIQSNPLYFSDTSDLHIPTNSPNVNAGTAIAGIVDDIDGDMRPNGPAPDIGADESIPSAGSVQFSLASFTVLERDTMVTLTVNRANGSNGAVSVDFASVAGGTATGGASCGAGVDYVNTSGTLMWADLEAGPKTFNVVICADSAAEGDETVNFALSNPTGGVTLGSPSASVLTISNSTIFSGSVNVGTGEAVTSLTNAGGLFDQINTGTLTANLTVSLTSDLAAETGSVRLDEFAGGFTLTLQPSGGARTVSGGSALNCLIDINGADGVTINGLNTGGNSLTIRNTDNTRATVCFRNDASQNTIQNATVEGGNTNTAFTTAGVVSIFDGVVTGNDNITISNNVIRDRTDTAALPSRLVFADGLSAAVTNTGTVISNNQIKNFTSTAIQISTTGNETTTITGNTIFEETERTTALFGLDFSSLGTNLVSQNTIRDLNTSSSVTGMTFDDAVNTTVSRNHIYSIPSTMGSGSTLVGIDYEGSSTLAGVGVTVVNNMISIVPAFANDQIIRGLNDDGFGGTFTAYFNTVLVGGTNTGTDDSWACVRETGAPTDHVLMNNLCFNNRTGGTGDHFAVGDQSNGSGTFTSNYNIFVGTGTGALANYFDKGTSITGTPVDFVTWQAGTRDANSLASNPGGDYTVANMFVSAADLHLNTAGTNPASNAGTPVMGVTTDFDNDTRSATTPEIGADEIAAVGNTPPTIMAAAGVARQEGSPASNSTIANVTDMESGNGAVTVTVTSANPSNGVTISNIVNTAGVITADIVAACGATNASFTLQASDGTLTATDTLNVSVTPNTAPTLTYGNASVSSGGSTMVSPATGPADNGTIPTIVVQSAGTYTGTISVDNATGVVSISNAAPVGMHTITIRATDNCGTFTDATFTLNVQVAAGGPVTVTATAGTPGPTDYPTLKDAIDAINAGTHQGDITVSIVSSTTETATSVLNSSGAGPAIYTSVLIRPTSDGVTVAGPSVQGRGLIELNGADNVTIDGDNPNTGGINRNLTIQNTAANTVTFTSVIRIALATSVVNTADNNTFKNLNVLGSATGLNIDTATNTTGPHNTTFGIFSGPGGSTADATLPPAPVTSVITGVGAGATAANLVVSNNSVTTAARAVSINGTSNTVYTGLQIANNSIGNPVAGDVNQVTAIGITAQGSTNAVISGNTVWVEGYVASSAAGHGINVGVNSTTSIIGATIERNKVNRVRNNNPTTWSAFGINLGGGNDHVVRNNFISGVINSQTAGTGGFGTTFGAYGIRVVLGTGHDIYHNSVHLYGVMPGMTSTNLTAAFVITSTLRTGMDVRNNIFSNQITGGNPGGTRHAAVFLPSGATSTMNLTWNNNAYYVAGDALNRLAQVGTTFGAGEYQAGDFDPTATTPATNFRAYTSTLSAAGTNDNASFAITGAPPFVSNTDLHIPAGTATRLESGGAAVGVTEDIDTEMRNATTPDIGADEFAGNPAPANDIGAVGFVVPANGSTIPTGGLTPQATFTNAGTATQTNVTVRFKIFDSMMVEIYNQTATIATISPLQNLVVSFPMTTIASPGMYTMQAAAELAGDQNTSNDIINGAFTAVVPITGTVNVGTGETFTSLTNPGGIFEALNLAGIGGNVTVNITSDLTAETGAVALNQLAESAPGGFTVTFKPSGAARVISGTSASSTGLITLNGADRIVFDGSLSGGTDRSLTITNNQTSTTTVFWLRSASTSNGATNNTIKNSIINGAPGPNSLTTAGILTGSGVTLGNDAESPNSNNTIQNNHIYRVQNSMYLRGGAGANIDLNWVVTGNDMGSAVANDNNIFRGMLIGNAQNFMVTNNTIQNVRSTATTTASMSGIQIALVVNGGTVSGNQITNIKNVSGTGTGANGISFISTSTASNVTVANNFVSDVAANGSATLTSNGFGINVAAGGGYKLYHNSVNLNTNQASGTTAALFVNAAVTTAGGLDVRNNIFANTQTAGATRRAVHSAAAAAVFGMIDYNDYFSTGSVGFIGGVDRPTLADWQTGTGQDVNSKAVDPLFVSPTDLHLQATSTLLGMGVSGTGITTDIDGQMRDTPPDIGADEIPAGATPGSVQFSSPTYSVSEAGGTVTLTVTRTGGSAGAISVNYATAGVTATGGASCAAGIDYVNANGTLNWADGDTTAKTFDVTICNDAVFEADETFTGTLSGATGGATIGTPNPATVTILNDDPPPGGSLSINDVRVFEGDAGAVNAMFTVTYSGPSVPVSVDYATANGTAVAGVDYLMAAGTLNFNAPGTQTVTVVVIGDVVKEANETFLVNLSNATGASISDGQGVGIIVDEDRPYVADFDHDHKSDFGVFRPSEGLWYVLLSTTGTPEIVGLGISTDVAVPGDYDGDSITDYAVWRPSTGQWYRYLSASGVLEITSWGTTGDKPVQGDYDGDGKTDLAIFRPSTGVWWIVNSSSGTTTSVQFGISTDRPVQGDYDGDFKTDRAVYRDGTWYILRSSDSNVQITNWGVAADRPVSGDFDGDGKFDLAIYRNGAWWVLNSLIGPNVVALGLSTDIPVPADYDGDGTTDRAVFRPSNGDWYVLRSSDGTVMGPHWGVDGDKPIPAAYLPQ